MQSRPYEPIASAGTAPRAQASEAEDASALQHSAGVGRCRPRAVQCRTIGSVVSAALALAAACAYFRSGLQGRRWLRARFLEAEALDERGLHTSLVVASLTANYSNSTANLSGSKNLTATGAPSARTTTTTVSPAPLHEFYMYRANARAAKKYEFGNINTGNLDGVVWYLMNEVVTMYTEGSRCPRKFNISHINRYKIKTRATKELHETGISFGTRFSYDFGMCMGRCFPDNQCSGQDDCDFHYGKYGYNVGCNNFGDKYPFPDDETSAPQGTWYALPLEGRCDGEPTGTRNCTWSYEDAGVVSLVDIEATNPWGSNCCPKDRCTGFWENLFDEGATSWRVQSIQNIFQEKYPDMPADLGPSQCDFFKDAWYTAETDIWPPSDPWGNDTETAKDKKPATGKGGKKKLGSEEWKDDSYNTRL